MTIGAYMYDCSDIPDEVKEAADITEWLRRQVREQRARAEAAETKAGEWWNEIERMDAELAAAEAEVERLQAQVATLAAELNELRDKTSDD